MLVDDECPPCENGGQLWISTPSLTRCATLIDLGTTGLLGEYVRSHVRYEISIANFATCVASDFIEATSEHG